MDKFCEDCIHNEVCQYGAIPPHIGRCNDKDTLDDIIPKGEWIRTGSLGNGNAQYECSNCHHGDEQAESQEVPYCWYCGAKMQKGGSV